MAACLFTFALIFLLTVVDSKIINKRQVTNECKSLNGEERICRNIKQCPQMLQLLNIAKENRTVARFLKRSKCGQDNQIPKVCCPSGQRISLPSEPNCGISTNQDFTRIVDGSPAQLGAWPWMAALGYLPKRGNGKQINFLCGGTLITDRHVLTAAHCLYHPTQNLVKVRLGDLDLNDTVNDGATPQEFNIIQQTPHENYDKSVLINDIALLKMDRAVRFNSLILPICIPNTAQLRSESFIDMNPFVAGWGDLYYEGPSSSHLQEVQLPIVENNKCAQALNRVGAVIRDTNICAGSSTEGKDSCRGDSGGPLMLPRGESFYIVGIVSYGYKCAEIGYPGVYTRVTKYVDWIARNL